MTTGRLQVFCFVMALALATLGCEEDSDGGSDPATPSGEPRFGIARGQISAGSAVSLTSTTSPSRFSRAGASVGQSGPIGVVAGTMSAKLRAGYWPIVAIVQSGSGTAQPLTAIAARPAPAQEQVATQSGLPAAPAWTDRTPAPLFADSAPPTTAQSTAPAIASLPVEEPSTQAAGPSSRAPAAVPVLGGAGSLLLIGSLVVSAMRLLSRRRPSERNKVSPDSDGRSPNRLSPPHSEHSA